jgi:hypothetical protein
MYVFKAKYKQSSWRPLNNFNEVIILEKSSLEMSNYFELSLEIIKS